jgi:hypothetical protein
MIRAYASGTKAAGSKPVRDKVFRVSRFCFWFTQPMNLI